MGLSVEVVRKPPRPSRRRWRRGGPGRWAKEGKNVDWQGLMPPRGYLALPRRWVVERAFSWISQNKRNGEYASFAPTGNVGAPALNAPVAL